MRKIEEAEKMYHIKLCTKQRLRFQNQVRIFLVTHKLVLSTISTTKKKPGNPDGSSDPWLLMSYDEVKKVLSNCQ